MLGLKSKNDTGRRPGWKPGCTALTPEQWHRYKSRKPGTYRVIASESGIETQGVERNFADAWDVFSRVVRKAKCTPDSGARLRIVAVER